MLAAEIHGKITDSSPPHHRMEDVLTSNVLSIFCYLNNFRIPTIFLSCARNLKGQRLDIPDLEIVHISFWPRFNLFGSSRHREADALLVLEAKNRKRIAITVEAKYESGLSNLSTPEMSPEQECEKLKDESMIQFSHQLADEYCGIKCGHWDVPEPVQKALGETQRKLLLYITPNYEIPTADLQEAQETIKTLRKCLDVKNGCSSETDIYWVSWRDLYAILEREEFSGSSGYTGYLSGERNYLIDVCEVLRLRGLKIFEPFQSLEPVESYTRQLTMGEFFRCLNPVEAYDPLFRKTLKR